MNKNLTALLNVVAFIFFMALIIVAQKQTGPEYLGIMLVGLVGLMVQLYLYNKKYQ